MFPMPCALAANTRNCASMAIALPAVETAITNQPLKRIERPLGLDDLYQCNIHAIPGTETNQFPRKPKQSNGR